MAYVDIRNRNPNPKPFVWTKTARDILSRVVYAKQKLLNVSIA
jgi:hypothetical protein